MFEDMTYETIMEDMLGRVGNDVDKREGSIIYDALAPCAFKLAETYYQLDHFTGLVFLDTAVGKYLDRKAGEYGIERKPAIYAERLIETASPIGIGTRWGIQNLVYQVTKRLDDNNYMAKCETSGEIGNTYSGPLENIDNVNGVTATLSRIITSGTDMETDEALRSRLYAKIQEPSTSGNADNYKEWALAVPGVGDAKVFPLWNGNGTVKVLVVNSDMQADETLVPAVMKHIEAVRPIGAAVTVDCPGEKLISISANIKLDGSQTMEQVQSTFGSLVKAYLQDATFDFYTISYAKIGSILLSTPGIADYSDLLVSGEISNISIGEEEMPIMGTITLTEVVS